MVKVETGLTKQQVFSALAKSPHGKLEEYLPIGLPAAKEDPEFFAHLIAWNERKGEVRDAKAALPIIALTNAIDAEIKDNALAHLAKLEPRSFVRALEFNRIVKGPSRELRRLAERYLRNIESDDRNWDRAAVQHRDNLRRLYALYHIKPSKRADDILFKGHYLHGTVFDAIRTLKSMQPDDAAGAIARYKIPFLIANGALGDRPIKEPDLAVAIINRMSPTELTTNSKMLIRWGIKSVPAVRGAYEEALTRASNAKNPKASMKAGVAAAAVGDEKIATKLKALQEKQLDKLSVQGNWLVIGDKSASMATAIEVTRSVAAALARAAAGNVYITFCNTMPTFYDATAKTLEEIQLQTRMVYAGGGTSLGCGLQAILERGLEIDGIAIVSDGGENTAPEFKDAYKRYCEKFEKDLPIYFYHTAGDRDTLTETCKNFSIDLQTFDLTKGTIDYYSLPNLVATMRTNRYSMIDEIMAMPLLRLDDVLKNTADTTKELIYAE